MTTSEPPDEGRHDAGAGGSPEDEPGVDPMADSDHGDAPGDRTETDASESGAGPQPDRDTGAVSDDTPDDDPDEEHAEQADGPDHEGPSPEGRPPFARRFRQKRWWVPISVVVVVALVAGAFLLGRGSNASHPQTASTVPPGFATYRSPDGSFSISYPGQWQVVPDAGVSLLLSAGGNDALSVREVTLQQPVDTKNVASIKAVTDAVLSTPSAQLQVLLSRPITIGGINGYYYLYTFPSGNTRGVHAHYFLFQGRKLTELVFQALPITDFQRLATQFDQVSRSFRSDPKVLPPPLTAPATTAPPTTAPGSTTPTP